MDDRADKALDAGNTITASSKVVEPISPDRPPRSPARRVRQVTSRRLVRQALRVAALLSLLVLLWAGGDLGYVTLGAESDHSVQADVIIVLGCHPYDDNGQPSPCIQARAGHAAQLYKQGLSQWVIATGGPTAIGRTETEALLIVLLASGVPSSAIVPEDQSHDTIQNIEHSAAIMRSRDWHTALLVTEPFHIKRATLIAQDAGLTVFPSPATDSPNWTNLPSRLHNLGNDALSLMLYQVKSLFGIKE